MNRSLTLALACVVSAGGIAAASAKVLNVKIPWNGDYPHNSDKIWSPAWTFGWSKNFLNGTPDEHGRVRKDGSLDAQVFLPAGSGPFRFVVLLHGCAGLDNITRKWIDEYAGFLNGHGVGVLALDSFSARAVHESCGKADGHWGRRRSEDAYSALDWLATSGYARMDEVYLIGRSNGGLATLLALENVMGRNHAQKFKAGIAMVPSCRGKTDAKFYAPLIILAAERDDANPAGSCEALAQHERPSEPPLMLIVYRSAFHGYMDHVALHLFHGWRLGYNQKAAQDTLKVIERTIGGGAVESKIEYR
jgi:dienelactone hydrolase